MKTIQYILVFILFGGLFQTIVAQSVLKDNKHPLIQLSEKIKYVHAGELERAKTSDTEQLLTREEQEWNGDEFSPILLYENIYSGELRTEERLSVWNPMPGDWIKARSILYQYENGYLKEITDQLFDGNTFENDIRSVLEYDDSVTPWQLITTTEQSWEGGEWVNDYLTELTYENGMVKSIAGSEWYDDQWNPEDLSEVSETDGDLYITYSYNSDGDWEPEYREIYHDFSINDLFDLFTGQLNFIETGSFMMFFGMLPDYLEEEWVDEEWTESYKQVTEEIFDESNNLIGKVIQDQYYDSMTEEWQTDLEITFNYNDGRLQQAVYAILIEENESNELTEIYAEDFAYDDLNMLSIIERSGTEFTLKGLSVRSKTDHLELNSRVLLTWSGSVTSVDEPERPAGYSLDNAYPNPFNPSAVIPFETASFGTVSIKVYDVLGRFVMTLADEDFSPGSHAVRFDGSALTSGVYMVRLQAPGFQQTKRVTLLK